MGIESKGRELFIVDNSVSGWTGLRYLEEWPGAFHAATWDEKLPLFRASEGQAGLDPDIERDEA